MYTCKCGREFVNKQSYAAHCSHCRINLGREPKDRFGDSRAWARGKTKLDNKSLASMAEKLSGKPGSFLGHTHSDKTKKIMSDKARYNAKNHINGWKAGSSKIPNIYEQRAEEILINRSIPYVREYVLPQSELGKTGSYYQLDFLIFGKIDLEIDGSSHNANHDNIRDLYVSKKYKVIRVSHNDSISELEIKLNNVLDNIIDEVLV